MPPRYSASVEPLEARIAPANVFPSLLNPLPDIVVGPGQSGAVVDLSQLFESTATSANHTIVKISTNFDADPNTTGVQGDIYIELFDDVAPLTVQNFLAYAFNKDGKGDYDGTFFHRLAAGFVLQGGGFQSNGTKVSHIDSLPEVHNEFGLSNLRGTLALAKTGLGPNTGTSEWFINLANNSGNLDNQNGGFTVFGQVLDLPGVVDGMDVVDAIGKLPTATVVQGFDAPVQNYNSDPDNNPATPAPKVKSKNLIEITDVAVVPPTKGDTSGMSYQVSVTQGSNLLSTSVVGSDLLLKYTPGQTGVAEVSVTPMQNGVALEPADTFMVTLQPNLITHIQSDGLENALVPGDTAKVKFDLVNTGGAVAQGPVEVHFFLSAYQQDPTSFVFSQIIPFVRTELTSIDTTLNLESGKTSSMTADVMIPANLDATSGTVYKLYAEVTPKTGFAGQELFTDDNLALEGSLHQLQNHFGTFSLTTKNGTDQNGKATTFTVARKHAVLTYTEPDGDAVSFSIKGHGAGNLVKNTDGSVNLELSGTDASTKVFAKVIAGTGDVSIQNIDVLSSVGSVQFDRIDVSGNLAFTGGVKTLRLGDLTGPSTLSIGLFAGNESQRAKLTFGSVKDLSVDSTMPIATLTATEWLNVGGAADAINAPSLASLNITGSATSRGDFEANVDITGKAATNSFRVAGLLNDSTIRLSGNVDTVVLGGMVQSNFLVGASTRPTSLEDFSDIRTISNFAIHGVAGVSDLFVDSTVAAARFDSVTVQDVVTANESDFGFVADVIKAYNRIGVTKRVNLTEAGSYDQVGQYSVTIL